MIELPPAETEQPDDPEATLATAIIGLLAALTFFGFAWFVGPKIFN